jgi:SAM-dependent methyltransferase
VRARTGTKASRKKRDLELEAGARAHYEDPAYYTHTYKRRIEDVARYVELACASGGPVLELGVGNGRIALPVARHGIDVVGVDWSREMLDDCTRRLAAEPKEVRARVKLKRGDIRGVSIGRKFPLIFCPFNTVLHLYTRDDVRRFFDVVKKHLAPGGTFVCDLSIPIARDLARSAEKRYGAPPFVHPTLGRVRYEEIFDYDRLRQILFISMFFTPEGGETLMTPLAHRQFYPEEWLALMENAGFRIARVEGDFTGGPLVQDSDVMVVMARPVS